MVELLIVITIIAVLATITIRVVGGFIETGRVAQTQATIKKIQGLIDDRLQGFNRLNMKGKETPYLSQAGNDLERAKVIMRKDILRSAFAQTWAEAAIPGKTDQNNGADSAEVLYAMLTKGAVFGVAPVSPDAFTTSEVQDTDGDGNLEFVDGWGKPLRFYRWPTRLIRPGGPGSTITQAQYDLAKMLIPGLTSSINDLNIDPDDPLARTANSAWPGAATFEADGFHTPSTYHTFLIVSIGPDESLGLYEPTDKTNYGHLGAYDSSKTDALTDNINNHNIKAGGK
jgi:type II secretory pathway pseudopilin PulG